MSQKNFITWIDKSTTPLPRVRQYLAWSGTRPLDSFILRRHDPSPIDPSQDARMRSIFNLLSPRLMR